MSPLRWIVVVLAVVQGGWLTFDGARALLVGDYLTPSSGPHAGQLGPWSRLVAAVGLDPRSTTVKCLHVGLGVAWLAAAAIFAWRPATGWWIVLATSAASLWYLPIGTVVGLTELVLLCLPQIRGLS